MSGRMCDRRRTVEVGLRKRVDVRACEKESKAASDTSKESYDDVNHRCDQTKPNHFTKCRLELLDRFRELIVWKKWEQAA